MTIEALNVLLSVCQITDLTGTNWSYPYTFLARTDTELSLVCPTEAVPENVAQREDGWRAFRVRGPLAFSLVGILARIASVLAGEGISIFALSTFDTDYVLLKEKDFSRALGALERNGYDIAV